MSNKIRRPLDYKQTKILACATVVEEMRPFLPDEMSCEIFDFGLHTVPENLKQRLQEAIDADCEKYDTIILGYGLCSMAVVGLESRSCSLVVPKVDDCIAIFLGSGDEYLRQVKKEPGTYYLTKGWIKVSDTPLDEYNRLADQFGQEKAAMVMDEMLKNYKRLVYIDTGINDQNEYITYAKINAEHFGLQFEKMHGSNTLVKKIIFGPWDDDFVVLPPGKKIEYTDFEKPIGTSDE